MKIGFLIIGSEVLDGKITDLNTKILADFLRHQHLEINEALTIRDHKDAIEKRLQTKDRRQKTFHSLWSDYDVGMIAS